MEEQGLVSTSALKLEFNLDDAGSRMAIGAATGLLSLWRTQAMEGGRTLRLFNVRFGRRKPRSMQSRMFSVPWASSCRAL